MIVAGRHILRILPVRGLPTFVGCVRMPICSRAARSVRLAPRSLQ